MSSHNFYMNMAIQNAKATNGQTAPNPLVGSVIVNDGSIVGIGTHLKTGEPHAEIHALRMAGAQAKGATIYVTLEPCSHHGRTGPCAEAIVSAGIKKVVIATLDPNPLVAGNGVKILQAAGIEVEVGVKEQEAVEMNEVFNTFITKQRPFVTMKAGSTLDGKIATRTRDSKWITSEDARTDVHHLRHVNQAILVGIGTVLEDDPELTTRVPNGRHPLRVIVDSSLKIPLEAKVANDGLAPTWVFTSQHYDKEKAAILEARGVKIIATSTEKRVNPVEVLKYLGGEHISSLLLEGGGTIHASFLEAGLVDKVVLYFAPKLVGGQLAPTFLEGNGVEKMAYAIEMFNTSMTPIGKDFKFIGYPIIKTNS
ncbi:bifunctional diaminohydroxyphosphoribosylaminopyrimidine deaminase/5-amino-6-(5-phosphoribosylamino)uracil reductase RibD [Alkalihalobacillus pseudalcaliphilus]|uniref:bifunctional diaminohydroxyphosphoribosylaminopyrimidine deaminase/5-amino-6-(5-phosphoribosylamino)uracil reductase RibD n=1 Tax=Alkalihalobacillus pseudalcaliphilus TaxID=79884 RepID=UPI00064D8D06|nr:bifunctional diaminohydroxyphosphoribosylaminopyrimidine deaminase/5-amino-6-(5-phosphoribosylamino)uracil reductase RibD [Alkalihalobacillus pseudalcaliphilus]KMK74984.1 5-amino-6-(5-phosphoribosylamino)uracil reductase [Alkalihalobacillus pseudalcaliphilus]